MKRPQSNFSRSYHEGIPSY